jgi:hypothetical protein
VKNIRYGFKKYFLAETESSVKLSIISSVPENRRIRNKITVFTKILIETGCERKFSLLC